MVSSDQNRKKLSEDSAFLGPMVGRGFCIGFVDEVNGPGGVECAEYVPTVHELRVLAEYWSRTEIDIDFDTFAFAQIGSTELRLGPYAGRRLGRIARLISEDTVREIHQKEEDRMRAKVDPAMWEAFVKDDIATRDRLLTEIYRRMDDRDSGS